ncbi:MAG: sulfatase [Thermoanaerobaculia bacterium]
MAALAIGACESAKEPGVPVELRFADYVGPQQRQVSTDRVQPDRERDGDRLGFGWAVRQPDDLEETVLEMRRETARLRFFSAGADARSLEIEAYWSGDPAAEAPLIGLQLNGQHLAEIAVGDEWQSYRIDVSAGTVRQGVNNLQLRREGESAASPRKGRFDRNLRLRHLRIHTADDRPAWSERPAEITLLDGSAESPTRPVIQMPTDSYLDLVAELPAGSRLVGHYTVEFPVVGARDEVTLYVELLDGEGQTRELMVEKLGSSTDKPQRLVVDLARWSGELARLRLGVAGPGDALVQWHDPRVLGRGPSGVTAFQGNEAASTPPRSGRLGRPDVVFILLDAARADAFSTFGGPYPTPALDRLAEEGTRFTRALAPSSWTGQSVPAVFTGLFPDTLAIEHWGSRLPPSVPTLAGLLQDEGYHTLLWSQHRFYRWHKDLQRGFSEVRLLRSRIINTEELSQQLDQSPQPTFAFVHLMPPHTPYDPPAPYRGLHSSWYQGDIPVTTGFLGQFPSGRDPTELGADDLRYIRDRYLEHAVFADSQVAEVLSILEELDRYDDALIVVLADHGEAFLEHGFFLHGQSLYDEFIKVPLLVKWPRGIDGFSSSIDEPVSLVDLVPTLVDGLGLASDRGFQGITLLPTTFGEPAVRRPLYSTTRGVGLGSQPPNTSSMLLLDGWKIIDNKISLETELYYLVDDPEEHRNLVDEMPLQALLLRQDIQRRIWLNEVFLESGGGEIDLETLDQEDIDHLRALGYLN